VVAEIRQGVWSEVSLESPVAQELGKESIQAFEQKNQSSRSKRGSSCLLVQVNLHPLRGSSIKLSLLIAELKANISATLPPGLFLFSGALSKLKSPTINHFASTGISIFLNQLRKANLPSEVQGHKCLLESSVLQRDDRPIQLIVQSCFGRPGNPQNYELSR
jgi:hypothetical protein